MDKKEEEEEEKQAQRGGTIGRRSQSGWQQTSGQITPRYEDLEGK